MAHDDEHWMRAALTEAREAKCHDDVPVGAVVVLDREIVGRGHNRRVVDKDPMAHAEVLALRSAAETLGSWRLDACTLYVTLEPCPMCAGAIVQSRVRRVVYGADDAKAGAVRSLYQLCDDKRLPHRTQVSAGVLADEAATLLRRFFADARSSSDETSP